MIDYPTFDDLIQQARAEMQTQLPQVDPTVNGSWARAFVDGSAVMAQVLTFLIRDLEQQLFPQTATGEFLEYWGNYEGLERLSPGGAAGNIAIEGATGTLIPSLTEFTGTNGYIYSTSTAVSITNIVQSIISITRVGSTATVTCSDSHNMATGVTVTVSGADQTEYNITATIVVTGVNTYQYEITGTPVTPATGTIEYNAVFASIPVETTTTGAETNVESGGQLTNITYGTGIVGAEGLTGGSDEESDDDYRERILLSRSIISGVFTPEQIKLAALSIAGNSRIFVKKPISLSAAGGYVEPLPGQVSVFILRDDGTVTQTVIDRTKQAIIDDGALPSEMSEADLFVQAPDGVVTDFTFSALSPNTPTMQAAIIAQLDAYFNDIVQFEDTVTQTEYLCVIQSSQSTETGEFIESFTLSSPAGDITVSDGEIATLGEVTYSV